MQLSIFDIIGPVMIGPSSSHTAGAAKLARIATMLVPTGWEKVTFALAGSFAKTGKGHGTDKALLAGALRFSADDERIRNAYAIAKTRGIGYAFTEIDLPDEHENTVRFLFDYADGTTHTIQGSSIGGGRICITNINGMQTQFNAEVPTVLIEQDDAPGVIHAVAHVLAQHDINIGVMRLSRVTKGGVANTVIEVDAAISDAIEAELSNVEHVRTIYVINV